MKVSIIVPVYNAASTLTRCLDSIINQTHKNIEIILINDGSKDNTLNICKDYTKKDKRIKLINKENSGVSNSRNIGIDNATGDYITFVDADDTLDAKTVETIIENASDDKDVIRYNFNSIGKTTFSNNLYDLKNKTVDIQKNREVIYKHFLTAEESIPNLVFLLFIKKELLKNIRFKENLYMMEDVEFYYNVFKTAKTAMFLDLKLYNYYNNPISVTHNPSNYKRNIFGIIDTNKTLIEEFPQDFPINITKNMNASHLSIISQYLINIYKVEASSCFQIIDELKINEFFQRMLQNANLKSIPLKNRIILRQIKNDNKFLLKSYFKTLKILYNLVKKGK